MDSSVQNRGINTYSSIGGPPSMRHHHYSMYSLGGHVAAAAATVKIGTDEVSMKAELTLRLILCIQPKI